MRRRTAAVIGTVVVIAAVASGFAIDTDRGRAPQNRMQVHLRTEQLGEGIVEGTAVRLDGVVVGAVDGISSLDRGRQLLTLDLDRDRIAGMSDNLDVAYAPSNLFGISSVVLGQAGAGSPLHDGEVVDLTGSKAADVKDETLGRLLRMLSDTTVEVLTPQLTQLITQLSGDLRQFTPFLRSITVLSRTVADTQRFAPSFLIDRYGSLAGGIGRFSSATVQLLAAVLAIPIFTDDHARFDATIDMLAAQAFPGMGAIGDVSKEYFHGYTELFTPTVQALAGTVPRPATSKAELSELLARLDRMFIDTPGGSALNVRVVLRGLPGLAVPLFGPVQGGQR